MSIWWRLLLIYHSGSKNSSFNVTKLVCVCMCVRTLVCGCMCSSICSYLWWLVVNIETLFGIFLSHSSTYLLRQNFSLNLELSSSARLSVKQTLEFSLTTSPQNMYYRHRSWLLMWTQVLKFALQILHWLSHVPSLIAIISNFFIKFKIVA